MTCVFCSAKDNTTNDLFCKSCNKILNKTNLHAFQLFDIDESYQIDKTSLKKTFLKLQSAYHPDKFVKAEQSEMQISMQNTTHINKAFKELNDDILRAKLLLELKGVSAEGKKVEDMDFLAKSFAWREQLMEACNLEELSTEIKTEYQQVQKSFADLYSEESYEQALEPYLKMKFYWRFLEEIKDAGVNFSEQRRKIINT